MMQLVSVPFFHSSWSCDPGFTQNGQGCAKQSWAILWGWVIFWATATTCPLGNGKKHRFNRFYTLSDEYRWYEHLSSLLSYPHLVSYHRNAMHLHLQFIRSLFCTSFFPYNFLLFSHGISFFFNYLSVSFPFIIQFIVIYCLLDIHLSSPLTATTRNQTTTLTVLCTSL